MRTAKLLCASLSSTIWRPITEKCPFLDVDMPHYQTLWSILLELMLAKTKLIVLRKRFLPEVPQMLQKSTRQSIMGLELECQATYESHYRKLRL